MLFRSLTPGCRRIHAEQFDRRQPEHIVSAGILGLGRFAASEIDHRVVTLRA